MLPREIASHPMTAEAVEAFNRLMSLYACHHTAIGDAWRSAERIMRALVGRVEELERERAEAARIAAPPDALF